MSDGKWYEDLEDESLRSNPVLATFKTPEDAYKGLIDLKAYQGRSIALPPEDAPDEMWSEFNGKLTSKVPGLILRPRADDAEDKIRFLRDLGMPEEETGYKAPEDLELPDTIKTDLTKIAFASGLTQDQYAALLTNYAESYKEVVADQVNAQAESKKIIEQKWGAAAEDNDNINRTLFQKFADTDHPVDMDSVPVSVRLMMSNMAKALTSDPQIFNQVQTVSTRKTPSELEHRIGEIRTLLLNGSVKGDKRKRLLQEQSNLYEELDRYG